VEFSLAKRWGSCEVLIRLVVVPVNHKNATQVEVASHTEPAFSPLPHQPHFKVGHGKISVDYELRSSYYAARARRRRYGLAVLGIAMVHVAQFLTSLTLNPSSDGNDFCKGVGSEISLHLLARSDLVSELGAREHGAMHALKGRSSDQKFGKPNPSS
jgi:hypothetical protein